MPKHREFMFERGVFDRLDRIEILLNSVLTKLERVAKQEKKMLQETQVLIDEVNEMKTVSAGAVEALNSIVARFLAIVDNAADLEEAKAAMAAAAADLDNAAAPLAAAIANVPPVTPPVEPPVE